MAYVLVDENSVVVNKIVWNGEAPYTVPEGLTLQLVSDDVQIADEGVGGEPVDPPQAVNLSEKT